MAGSSSGDIVEVIEAAMVSPTGGIPTLRPAHFLKPSTDSIVGPLSKLKLHSLSLSSSSVAFQVRFSGWKYQQKNRRIWVQKMASLHESTWRKAGIFEAIMNSTYTIFRNVICCLELQRDGLRKLSVSSFRGAKPRSH
ncbi:hypothetical protein SLA2020_369120 [Shorea laevis]